MLCHVLEDPHPSLRRHSVQLIVRRQRVLIAADNVLRPGVVRAEVGDAEIHLDPEPVLALGLLRRESLRKLHLGWLLLVEMRSRLGGRMGVVCVLLTDAVRQIKCGEQLHDGREHRRSGTDPAAGLRLLEQRPRRCR